MKQIGELFLKEKPSPIKFGTSGLRAPAAHLTDLECYINMIGFIDYLKNISREDGGIKGGEEIYLAGDFRPSTPRIMNAIAKAIQDSGCRVINCGNVSSPAVAYCGMLNNCASIMVTGSHIPEDRNGIKPNKANGEILKAEEVIMGQYVAKTRERVYKTLGAPDGLFDENAMFINKPAMPEVDEAQVEIYIKRYTDLFPNNCLGGKKIVIYQHSSVGRDAATEIFKKLGADVIVEGRTDEFISIDTEAIKEEELKLIMGWAEKHRPFALISLDGDGDRPWLSNERGEFLRGDLLGALTILYLGADFGAVPLTCNDAVDKLLESKAKLTRTKIGSPYVIKSMMDAAKKGFKKIASWEVNGGFLTLSDFEINGKILKSLPTRDAILPMLCVLLSAIEKNTSISAIMDSLPKRYTDINKIKEFPNEIAEKIVKKYSPKEADIEKLEFFPEKIIITRQDESAETMEKNSSFWNEWMEKKEELENKYLIPNSIGKVVSFIYTDGLKITTENKEIVHLRQSSNAPEFRCYTNADSPRRAEELVRIALTKMVWELKSGLER